MAASPPSRCGAHGTDWAADKGRCWTAAEVVAGLVELRRDKRAGPQGQAAAGNGAMHLQHLAREEAHQHQPSASASIIIVSIRISSSKTHAPPLRMASARRAAQLVGAWARGAATASRLDDELVGRVCTVFVPTDDAIRSYVAASGAALADLATPSGRASVQAHIVPDRALTSADFPTALQTAAGTTITVHNSGGLLSVSGGGGVAANVVKADVSAGSAVLFMIDRVLAGV
ncbi:hypothetical protein TSOC_003104 [Tetrabaena socialis]|uniref:FAS1 domain-containing protein n=1 Tax=Tetrabaena socialis TaxID=47790 RepID=A0A2J8ACG3_9CHLO|nr:hypothetical protein TSOC_003104 [Tetrabaena socialis]|eukprot:PNH10212.1 hypothetical protein TSOC_003104 [Tetrabaena socialis]